jgi:hypothetical protein
MAASAASAAASTTAAAATAAAAAAAATLATPTQLASAYKQAQWLPFNRSTRAVVTAVATLQTKVC